jgi:hypothetical protein
VNTKDRPRTTRTRLNTKALERRVRQHGGILEAIEWGLRSEAIEDPELATVWRGIEAHYEEMRRSLVVASRMLTTRRPTA